MTYNPNFSGSGTVPASQALRNTELNNTGSTLAQLTPVKITLDGNLGTIDVSVESDVHALAGIVDENIPNGASGNIITSGRVLNISTSAAFGMPLYLSKSGGVTDTIPDIGVGGFVAGDFVVSLGIVAKNAVSPSNKDLIVRILILGQL